MPTRHIPADSLAAGASHAAVLHTACPVADVQRDHGCYPSPVLIPLSDALRLASMSKSQLYRHLAAGDIEARKAGKRTLIVLASLQAYLDHLPAATFRASQTAN